MQDRMKQKIQTLDSKVDVIQTQWTQLLFRWGRKAAQTKDEGMKRLLQEIISVKPEIRDFVLRHYIS